MVSSVHSRVRLALASICASCLLLCQVSASDPPGNVRDLAKLTWAILETIERQHISPPTRNELIKVASPGLTGLSPQAAVSHAVDLLQTCHTDDEFADQLDLLVGENQLDSVEIGNRLESVTKAIQGELGTFRLIPKKERLVEDQFRNNRYVGLGVTISADLESKLREFPTIVPGGPADRAGLIPGTTIYEVNGQSTYDVPIATVVEWIRGPAGSDVTLKVSDHDNLEIRIVNLKRGLVRMDSLADQTGKPLSRGEIRSAENNSIGWIAFRDITSSTVSELRTADTMARSAGIRALVIDFRSYSRSDTVHQARQVADALLDGGKIWYSAKRDLNLQAELADRECLFRGIPLIVIVGQNTGPGHSAVAAALQDANRATIVGGSPHFTGKFATYVPLWGDSYFVLIDTHKLTRSHPGEKWPLVPDYSSRTEENAVELPVEFVIRRLNSHQRMKTTKSRKMKPRMLDDETSTPDQPVSALMPVNLYAVGRPARRPLFETIENSFRIRLPLVVQPFPLVPPSEKLDDELAVRIATKLIAKLPAELE